MKRKKKNKISISKVSGAFPFTKNFLVSSNYYSIFRCVKNTASRDKQSWYLKANIVTPTTYNR
jgi:hypothetical protein